MLDAITRDVRHAMHGLTKTPGYALVFIVRAGRLQLTWLTP